METKPLNNVQPDETKDPQDERPSDLDLEEIEIRLRTAVRQYVLGGKHQFCFLRRLCSWVSIMKSTYMARPPSKRSIKTWAEYAPTMLSKCDLECSDERMADYYIALHRDMTAVGVGEVAKRITEGGYREARRVTDLLMKKVTPKKAKLSQSSFTQAARLVRKGIKEMSAFQQMEEVSNRLELSDRAYRERDIDVVPELSGLNLPESVRREINMAVRSNPLDPMRSGLKCFDHSSIAIGAGGVTQIQAWVVSANGKHADFDIAFTNWSAKRNALSEALRRLESARTTLIRSGGSPGLVSWDIREPKSDRGRC